MSSFKHIDEIGPDFYQLRGKFLVAGGLIDIKTHMSFVRLGNGRFIVIDTCDTSNESVIKEINLLTRDGELIDAVLATHPYHTVYFRQFYYKYPRAKYYGAPRHLEIIPEIPWAGSLNDESVRDLWEPEIEIRIPAGADFVNTTADNHFISAFVFHPKSKV
jgi:hypothetical protein